MSRPSYANLRGAVRTIIRSRSAVSLVGRRVALFVSRPRNLYWLLRAILLAARHRHIQDRFAYLRFWLVVWSTVMLKYQGLTEKDFDIESVPPEFDRSLVLPKEYVTSSDEPVHANKIKAQQRYTTRALGLLTGGNSVA